MTAPADKLAKTAEALVVGLARTGDREAFAELVRRKQSWMRNFMRRCSSDPVLADDLSQQTFLQAWRDIPNLRRPQYFSLWLKKMAINVWRQHLRRNDVLFDAGEFDGSEQPHRQTTAVTLDLDTALATLPEAVRLCIVLAYHEGLTHPEISDLTGLAAGTVKSHIRRGSKRLQDLLAGYAETPAGEIV